MAGAGLSPAGKAHGIRKRVGEWLAVEHSKFVADVEAWEKQQAEEKQAAVDALPEEHQRIVQAMETAGFLYDPHTSNPGLRENLVFRDASGYPLTFETWEQVYEQIDSAELRDTPGLREQVQTILHPAPAELSDAEYARQNLIPGETIFELDGRTFQVSKLEPDIGHVERKM